MRSGFFKFPLRVVFPAIFWLGMAFISVQAELPSTPNGAKQNSPSLDISSQVDRSEITIGDQIHYEIKVVYPAEGHVELPSVLGNLGAFEVKDYQVSEPKPAGKLQIQTWQFSISTFTVGKYTLPPQQVVYRNGTDTSSVVFFTQPIEINVIRTSPETVKDIADIAPLAKVPGGKPWLLYALGALLVLALGLFWWKRLRGKSQEKAEKPPLPPFEEAMVKLDGLRDLALIKQNKAGEFCFLLSELLRHYISRRYGIDALESTSSEFLRDVQNLTITRAQKEWLGKFCAATDLVKFADAAMVSQEAESWIKETAEFLSQTKPSEEVEK